MVNTTNTLNDGENDRYTGITSMSPGTRCRQLRSSPALDCVPMFSLEAGHHQPQTSAPRFDTSLFGVPRRLIELEEIIKIGQRTLIEVGSALAEIRDGRLYRPKFKTFEKYCWKKWGYKRAYAYKLIEAAAIATDLSTVGYILSERVAREFTKVPKDQRKEIFQSSLAKAKCEGRTLTAKDISEKLRPDSRFFKHRQTCRLGNSVVTYYCVYDFPISKIILSSEVPNFKTGADPLTGVVPDQELHSDFIPLGTAPLVIWLRRNGIYELVTGRHRRDLAKRMGETNIAVHIVREDQGFSVADAKMFDAFSNIRDSQGSIKDYAHFVKNSPVLTEANAKKQGLLDRVKGRDGWNLGKNASDDLYAFWMGDNITTEKATAIVEAEPTNHNLQQLGLKQAIKGMSASDIKNFIHAINANAGGNAEQIDLLGRDDSAIMEAEELAALATKHQREINEKIRAVRGSASRPTLAAQAGVIVNDPESALDHVSSCQSERQRWQKWWLHDDLKEILRVENSAN